MYREVYKGIDLIYSGDQRRLKYTFHIVPGADPNDICMIFDGVDSLSVDNKTNELVIHTKWGEIRDAAPVAYQEINGIKNYVGISFRLIGDKCVGFKVGNYDEDRLLTIDPIYSTYLGGNDHDIGRGIAVDNFGNAYVTGTTYGCEHVIGGPPECEFPIENAFQPNEGGIADAFITKIYAGTPNDRLKKAIRNLHDSICSYIVNTAWLYACHSAPTYKELVSDADMKSFVIGLLEDLLSGDIARITGKFASKGAIKGSNYLNQVRLLSAYTT